LPESPFAADRRRLWIEWFATAIFSTVLLFTLVSTGATNRLDEAIYDFSIRLTHFKPRPDIVIVAIDAKSLEQKGAWPWSRLQDAELISRIAKGHPKALGCLLLFVSPGPPGEDAILRDAMSQTRTYLGTPRDLSNTEQPWLIYKPIPILAAVAAGIGPADAEPDEHAVVRRAFLLQGSRDKLNSQIVLQMARLVGPGPPIDLKGRPTGGGSSPLYHAGEMLIPFVGPPGTIEQVPASAVLDGSVRPGIFENKFVLLGPTAPALLDQYQTPTSIEKSMTNIEIEANILDALLSKHIINKYSNFIILTISIFLICVLLVGLVRLGPRDNLWLSAIMAGVPLCLSIIGVATRAFWLPPTPYLATLAIIVPYWGWRRLNAASAYFSDQLVEMDREAGGLVPLRRRTGLGGDVVLQQITLLEDAKRRIADLRRFVDDILANFPDPVFVVDCHGIIARTNAAAASFAGQIGVTVRPGEPIEPVLATIVTTELESPPVWPPEVPGPGFEGGADVRPLTGEGPEGRTYELRFTPTTGARDQPTGWIVHLADVTPLVAAMRQREEALQLLSHDMRSPQAAILAILNHPDFRETPAALRQRIEGQARRTLEMADAFVRLAQAESARYNFEQIDLTHVMRDAADAVWGLSQSAGVKVIFEPDDVEYVVLADRRLLTRALINLLDNAIKFSPRDKSVTCRLTPDQLEGAAAVACEIADSAGGMAQAQLADLFHRFATSRDDVTGSQGVGLGLALVHTVVTRHHGVIRCESARGEGTVFTLTLPLDETADVESLAKAEA
jgi:CHASE2 domain-containing sensor protein/two-component sensor histidine kinase